MVSDELAAFDVIGVVVAMDFFAEPGMLFFCLIVCHEQSVPGGGAGTKSFFDSEFTNCDLQAG